ncbi:MAG: hypothetical protein KC487_14735, partial [Anaerolineae bacterium]|nr:hypothetical protein [Anaerolineae bacterium]
MKQKNYNKALIVTVIAAVLIGLASIGASLPAEADEPTPAAAVQDALDAVRASKSHRFSAEVREQVTAVDAPAGSEPVNLTMLLDGEVAEPGHARLTLTHSLNGRDEQTEIVQVGNQAYVHRQGNWSRIPDALGAAGPAADAVALLDAVTEVQRLPDAPSAAGVSRHYTFAIDRDRYAALMQARLEKLLSQESGIDVRIAQRAAAATTYWNVAGTGDLWIGEDGLPQRLQLDLALPEVTAGFDARLQMQVDYRDFGAPIAPVEAPG